MSLAAFFFSTMPKEPPGPVIWYPSSTVSYDAGWVTSSPDTPASMHTYMDEVTADDADWARISGSGTTKTAELGLGGASVTNIDYAVLKIRLKWAYGTGPTLTLVPILGGTSLAALTPARDNPNYTDYTWTIPNATASGWNLASLRLVLSCTMSGASATFFSQITLTIYNK